MPDVVVVTPVGLGYLQVVRSVTAVHRLPDAGGVGRVTLPVDAAVVDLEELARVVERHGSRVGVRCAVVIRAVVGDRGAVRGAAERAAEEPSVVLRGADRVGAETAVRRGLRVTAEVDHVLVGRVGDHREVDGPLAGRLEPEVERGAAGAARGKPEVFGRAAGLACPWHRHRRPGARGGAVDVGAVKADQLVAGARRVTGAVGARVDVVDDAYVQGLIRRAGVVDCQLDVGAAGELRRKRGSRVVRGCGVDGSPVRAQVVALEDSLRIDGHEHAAGVARIAHEVECVSYWQPEDPACCRRAVRGDPDKSLARVGAAPHSAVGSGRGDDDHVAARRDGVDALAVKRDLAQLDPGVAPVGRPDKA